MRKCAFFICLSFYTSFSFAQNGQKEKEAILQVMETQRDYWNKGDIEDFM